MLPQLKGILGTMDDDEEISTPDPMAQAMELRDRFDRLNIQHRFSPGDLAREKWGIGPTMHKFRTVWVVIRHLTDSAYDKLLKQEHVNMGHLQNTAHEPDLVCANIINSNGKQLGLELVASAILEPVSDADLSTWPLPPEERK